LPRYLQPDPELDSLSIEELEDRARALHNPYRPQNAAMLIRLANAWSRRSAERPFRNEDFSGTDPLSGLPDIRIFGDPNILASDAARFPGATRPQPDIFETETLTRRTRTPEELARAQDFTEEEQTVEAVASAGVTHSRRASFGSVGRVDTLTDGLRLWNFASNSARLRTQFETPLRQLAVQALTNPLLRFEIDGHTDSAGAPTNNARLSEQRALAVAQFLINTGVPASRIRTQAFGENNPVAVEHRAGGAVSLEGMARNRRVEIRVTTLGGQTVDEEVLRRARQQGGTLGTQARPERIPGNYDSIDWYTVGGIATDVIAELSSYGVLAPAWELMAFVGPVLNIIGLVDSLNTAQGQQERGNRRRGIVLGLRAVGGMSRSTDLSVNITAAQLERMIHTDWWLEREWLSQITYSYPLGPQGAIANMRHGLRQVATRVNEGMRTTERYFRHRLEQTGMSPQDIETVYNHEIQRIRRQVLDEMLTAAFRALGP
jgi:outer membrane protein OmpA-like peptidoglycan-associated protein